VLDAGLLPRRAYDAGLIGQTLVAAALGSGHRLIARDLDVPHGTVRGWIRRARRSAGRLRAAGVQAIVALGPHAVPAQVRPSQLAYALDALGAAAMALGDRFGVQHTSPWARVAVLTRGQLLTLAPDS
jgi:transposase-like protein